MANFLSPIGNDQTLDANGDPLTGGQIETYLAGSTTPAGTFTSANGSTAQPNPIILDSLGYPPSPIWLAGGTTYKFVIKNALGVTLKTLDGISGINDAAIAVSEWVSSGLVPTFLTATTFSVPGDQRAILQIGRRIRTTNTGGIVYSGITNATFSGVTTVTVVNDSGVLDSGMSVLDYGLISADNTSFPFATFSAASTIALSDDGTTATPHYLIFADGTAGQENMKTDTAKLAYNPSTGDLTGQAQVGDIKYVAKNVAPAGWLKANGATLTRATYPALWAAVNPATGGGGGVGNGTTTFTIPDLRGEFIRGWDDARGIDSGRAFGSFQDQAFESHLHGDRTWNWYRNDTEGSHIPGGLVAHLTASGFPYAGSAGGAVSGAAGGAETRPRNVALLACIKF